MVDQEVRVEALVGEGVVLTDGADGEAPTSTDNGNMAFPMTSVEVEAGGGNGLPDVLLVANKTSEESPSNKIDLSASGYTLKKLKELEAIRAERARRQHDSVSEIIARLDERGIGKVSLQGVQVEAFAHPIMLLEQVPQVAQDHDYAAYAAALKEADDDALAKQEQEVVGELKNTNNLGADIFSSKSMENHLQRAFESASGLHRESGRTLSSTRDAGYEVVHGEEDDGHFYASALRHVEGGHDANGAGGKPKGAGAYKEHITSDASVYKGKNNSDAAAGKRRTSGPKNLSSSGEAGTVEVVRGEDDDSHFHASALKVVDVGHQPKGAGVYKEKNKSDAAAAGKRRTSGQKTDKSEEYSPKQKEELIAQFDASGVGVNVDGLHAQAYSMNASKYDASFKSRKGTLMGDGSGVAELAPQKDLDEVVGNLANRKGNAQDPISREEVVVPDRDAGADEYERQLKAKLNEAKEKAGPAPNKNGPVLMVENKPLSPDQHEQQVKKPRPPKMENRDLHNDGDGEESDDSDYVGEVNALRMEDDVAHEEEPEEKEMAGEEEGVDNSNKDDATEDEQEKEMAGGEEGMDNSNRASHIEDDATEEELEADAERKEQERLAAAEEEEAAKQAELEEAARKKAAGEADQEDGQPVSEDEQPVSEPASEVDDEKPAEMNGKPAPEPPVVETKEKPAPEPPVVEPKKVKDDTTASSAAAATKVGTEIQAEATGGCCDIL